MRDAKYQNLPGHYRLITLVGWIGLVSRTALILVLVWALIFR